MKTLKLLEQWKSYTVTYRGGKQETYWRKHTDAESDLHLQLLMAQKNIVSVESQYITHEEAEVYYGSS